MTPTDDLRARLPELPESFGEHCVADSVRVKRKTSLFAIADELTTIIKERSNGR